MNVNVRVSVVQGVTLPSPNVSQDSGSERMNEPRRITIFHGRMETKQERGKKNPKKLSSNTLSDTAR